jgi:uroporphyrinogen-III decarboxylase
MREAMTSKERWLAAAKMEPVDRLPFWPKLDAAYPRAQAGRFYGAAIDAIHDWIGSDRHVWVAPCVREVRERCSLKVSTQGIVRRTVYRTRYGEAEMVTQFDGASQAWHPTRFPVRTRDDIRLMTAYFEDTEVVLDADLLEQARARIAEVGPDGIVCSSIGESPLMRWVEWIAGVENAHLLLADYTAEVEALFEAMHRVLLEKTRLVVEHSPVDMLYMTENTSTTLISPGQYRRYCYPHIHAYGEIARRHGRILALHMCGHLKLLLPMLSELPAQAFEAFTSPPVGNTRLADGRGACPDKCLIGGTNAVLWTRPPEEIVAEIERDLDALPHHRGVAVTSAGVMPPLCPPETIRAVCTWVKHYPVRM